ncbi:MAG: SpoIID/LytB domain-containing protein [Planctomycetes bacterium]|nr:SpoIID/LytB domain-containing protein [Planctomycetota bacterium]
MATVPGAWSHGLAPAAPLLLLLAALACAPLGLGPKGTRAPEPARADADSREAAGNAVAALQAPAPAKNGAAAPRWKAEGLVSVRLSRFEQRGELVVRGARGGRGASLSIEVHRQGAALRVAQGAAPSAEALIEPQDPAAGLQLDGARYRGKLRLRPHGEGGLSVDNLLDLEDYVAGVVAGEVQLLGSSRAELEAQAIASRSFALAQFEARGARSLEVRLQDSTRDQRYVGVFEPTREERSQRAARELAAAIEATRGLVLEENGATLDARFHAACGGRTADAADVFPEAARFRSLTSVDCPACGGSAAEGGAVLPAAQGADLSWRASLDRGRLDLLARALGVGTRLLTLAPLRRDRGGRWVEVEVTGDRERRQISFETLRRELRDNAVASNLVLLTEPRPGKPIEGSLMFVGRGRGHGVGLCQNGCRVAAARGWSAERILAHFYPESAVVDGRR